MYVLGIETSCDETAASIVKDGSTVLSSVVSSSLDFHKKYGGIVPEIAFRKQEETIAAVVDCAVKESGVKLKQLGLISVTNTPGLLGALLVGISFAKSLSLSLNLDILGVNHLYGHIYAAFLNMKLINKPFIALIVSGGHTSIFYIKDFAHIEILGTTVDDACGEAFDKVAKILDLGYPGGPVIEKTALAGDSKKIKFGCSNTNHPLNFSFSGIKTAVLYYVQKNSVQIKKDKSKKLVPDICASFQEACVEALLKKSFAACSLKKADTLVIGGGVAANSYLRNKFFQEAESKKIKVIFPEKKYCMDNAAMIAGLGYELNKKGLRSDLSLNADLIRGA